MNAQQELVAYWKFCEERGLQPSVRAAIDHCRRMQVPVSERVAYEALSPFSAQNPHNQNRRQHKTNGKTAQPALSKAPRQHLARAAKVSLSPKPITETKVSAKKAKAMKQTAMDLGVASAPEIDFDRRRLDPPKDLPDQFPDTTDELRDLALVFCRTFTYAKDPAKLKNHVAPYTDVLAGMRKQRIPVLTAWMAFREAVIAQEGRALFGHTAKRAYVYLPNGAAHKQRPPMPRLGPGETARWDEDARCWMVENVDDPPTAQELLKAKREGRL